MKCIPITCAGRRVAAAIFVIEIEEVLVAKMQLAGVISSSCLNILSFKSTFSVAASTTKSAFLTPSVISVKVRKLLIIKALCCSVIVPFANIRSAFFIIFAMPLSNATCEISVIDT